MKTRNIFLLALSAIFAAACHTWDEPSAEAGMESYGNQYIQETNVVTIDALKTQYKSVISSNGLQQITKPTQIKVIVTGNDEGSNLYKQLYVTDGTGSLYMSIDKSGIFSEAAVGQCMLIELEGLYIGAYGKQPEIGTFYHNESKNTDQVGRMSRYTWQDHFKLIPAVEGLSAEPEEVLSMSALDMEKDCGKLVKLIGVKMKGADGKITFAPSDGSAQLVGGCVNRDIDGMSNVVVRTSTYAKYAAMIMPTEAIDITGIAARYNNTWQIMPRTQDDIQKSTHEPITPPDPAGTGTKDDPYNVAGVLAYVESLGDNEQSPNDVYFSGIITSVTEEFTTQYGNGTFIVSDDEYASNSFTFYRGYYLSNKKFTASDTQVKKGDNVVICGKVTKFVNTYGTTPETVSNKAYIYSLNGQSSGDGGGGGTTPSGENILSNGNFETWTDGIPTDWKTTSAAGNATLTQSTDARNGSYSVSVGFSTSANKRLGHKEMKLKAGTYTFSFYAKATTADKSQTQAGYVPVTDGTAGSYKYGGYVSINNTEWTLVSTTFTLEAATTVSVVMMCPKNSDYAVAQNILVDDATLVTSDGGIEEGGSETGGGSGETANHGTADAPLTVAQAIALIDAESTINEAYVKGKISQIDSYNATYKSITYWISDDGGTTTQLQVYSGKGLNGADFSAKEDLTVGQTVVIKGKLKKYNTTYEFDKTSSIISIQ